MTASSELRERILETLWSQWHELGVAATVPRRHADDLIDPEPLIAFTASHGDLDPRLRDESIDWVVRYGAYVSKARLKNVLSDWGVLDEHLFREYAATVNAQRKLGWPAGRAKPLPFRARGRSRLADLSRPALVSLRIRAIFGVGARAELLRALLSRPQLALTAADLSIETSYRKRNVLNELEPLRFAGVVKSFRATNADRYSLAMIDEVGALVRPLPVRFTRWTQTFGVLHLVLDAVRQSAKRSELENAVAAVRLRDEREHVFTAAGMKPPRLPTGVSAWSAFLEWAVREATVISRS